MNKGSRSPPDKLRQQAETRLAASSTDDSDLSKQDAQTLIQELRTHQLELEIQNEELQRVESELTQARDRFSDLYDFAPVGYLTISEKGIILQANLRLSEMVGQDRSSLLKQRFSSFIEQEDQDYFYQLRRELLASKHRQSTELRMRKSDQSLFWALIEASLEPQGDNLLLSVTNIDTRKQKEAEMLALQADLTERGKELRALYGVDQLLLSGGSIETVLQQTAALLPPAMSYPDMTSALISYDGHSYGPEPVDEPASTLSSDIVIKGDVCGSVELFCSQPVSMNGVGPFLQEEMLLIESVADSLSRYIEQKLAEDTLSRISRMLELRNRISQVFLTRSDDEMYGDVLQIILDVMQSRYGVFGYIDQAGALVVPSMTRDIWEECSVPDKNIIFPRETWGESAWPTAIREKKPNFSNQPTSIIPAGHIAISRYITLPIIYHDEVIGLFQLANRATDYGEQDVLILQEIADHVAPILYARLEAERKTIEVIESNDHIKLLLDSTAEAIYGIDLEGNCTLLNRSGLAMLGYDTGSELLGKNMHEMIHHTHADGTPYLESDCKIVHAMQQGKGVHVDDELFWRRDGTSFPASYWSYPIFQGDQAVGSVVTFLDISQQLQSGAELASSREQLQRALEGTIEAISRAVGARDPYTAGHQRRVAHLATAMASQMELDARQVKGIRLAATIHDIGKIQVPAEILSKPSRLSEAEHHLVQVHAQAGFDILKGIKFPWPVALIAYQHHERLDGSGYPQGLKGDQISLEARIVAVADVVEAMASHRPYRPSLGMDMALEEIKSGRGSLFDSRAVDACVELIEKQQYTLIEVRD